MTHLDLERPAPSSRLGKALEAEPGLLGVLYPSGRRAGGGDTFLRASRALRGRQDTRRAPQAVMPNANIMCPAASNVSLKNSQRIKIKIKHEDGPPITAFYPTNSTTAWKNYVDDVYQRTLRTNTTLTIYFKASPLTKPTTKKSNETEVTSSP